MKSALITGITGMVGSHLLDYLLKKTDWQIYGLIRWRSNLENIVQHIDKINKGVRVKLLYGDLNDYNSLINVINNSSPNYVFHLAAQSYPQTSFESASDTYNTNIIGTSNLLEVLRKSRFNPWIHVCASSEVFGRVPKNLIPIKEDTPFHPASPYAISKVGTDLVGRYHAEAYGQKIITTRMFTHTGPRRGDVFAESSFAKQIAMIESNLIPATIKVGNLNSLRTFSDVRDAVRAYHLMLTIKPIKGEYYNIGGSYTCKIGEMLDTLLSLSKIKKINIKVDKNRIRPIDADLQVPDVSKFTGHTGWKPEIKFNKTMKDLLNYWRDKVTSGNKYLQR